MLYIHRYVTRFNGLILLCLLFVTYSLSLKAQTINEDWTAAVVESYLMASSTVPTPPRSVPNSVPVARDDVHNFIEGAIRFDIDVLSNDYDSDGDPLTLQQTTEALYGTVVVSTDNTISYTPKPGYLFRYF